MSAYRVALLDSIAVLFDYPAEGYLERVLECRQAVLRFAPEASEACNEFVVQIGELSQTGLQELFTSTFDLNPVCSLEVGWHLFGENYERGRLLVRLRQELRRLEVPETTELPDHLSQVFRAVGRMENAQAAQWISEVIQPALVKMREGLKKQPDNPFSLLLRVVELILQPLSEGSLPEVIYD